MNEMPLHQRTSIGSYDLLSFIGSGPTGRIYQCEDQNDTQQKIVLKVIEAIQFQSTADQQQVLEQVRALAELEYRFILPILDAGIDEDVLYLASPYMEAGSLRQRLADAPGGLLPMNEVLSILKQIGEALHFAHQQQIVHANLKPENVLFSSEGEAVLADFRLDALIQSTRTAQTFAIFAGGYMAPEQFQGEATPLSDQYALACLAYKLLTGHALFEADNLVDLAYKHATEQPWPPALLQPERARPTEQVILKALSKQPEERYADIQTFLSELLAASSLAASSLAVPISVEFISQDQSESVTPPPSAPDSEEQTVVLLPFVDPAELPELAEEHTKAVVVEADAAHSPHPALLAHRRPATHMLKRRPVLTAIVSVAVCLSLLGLLLSFFPGISSPTRPAHSPARLSARSPVTISSLASPTSTPGPTPVGSPPEVMAPAPASRPMPPAPGNLCQLGATTITQEAKSVIENLTIVNTGSTVIKSWTLVFSFAGKPTLVISVSNGVFAQMGHQFTISSPPADPALDTITPGSSVHTSFQATWKGNNPLPVSFKLTRLTCSARPA